MNRSKVLFVLFSACVTIIILVVLLLRSASSRAALEAKAARVDSYCHLVKLSFESVRDVLSDQNTSIEFQKAAAERLHVTLDARLRFDDLLKCTSQPFDLSRYDGCVHRYDQACLVAMTGDAANEIIIPVP